jgi:Na+/phosphate symporter
MMKKVKKDNEIKQEQKKVMARIIKMIISTIKQMIKEMRTLDQDLQEI